jgi:UDP-N-acetylmuramate dehydrogenase
MNMSDLLALSNRDPSLGELRADEPMARHVSWKAGGPARRAYTPASLAALMAMMPKLPMDEPIIFVGLGSNLLVRDGGFAGTVVFTHRALTGLSLAAAPDGGGDGYIAAAAGVPAPHLAKFAANHGLADAEWLAGVPGTVGGALAMNAGCYGGETWDHVIDCRTINRAGMVQQRTPADFSIGYRHVERLTDAGVEEWFVSATLRFPPGHRETARERIKTLLAKRVASQPLSLPNAGSVFRNPEGDHAGRLIEAAGLKGTRIGGALVSPKHANFIINQGGATAADIEDLIALVQAQVAGRFGVTLIPEVRIIGEKA